MNRHFIVNTVVACAIVTSLASVAQAVTLKDELYRDQMTSGAGWGVNASSGDSAATFGYDYSADFIPEAPNSRGGDTSTTGVKLEANLTDGALDVFTLYPIGQNFTGNYVLRFDAWMNYDADERINGGSAGTTEFLGGGIGYNNVNADIGVGAQGIVTGDGGSGSDYRAFADGAFFDPGSMTANDRNGFNAHYSDFLPGVAPPAGQAQTDFPAGTAGSPGFQWVTHQFSIFDGVVEWRIEKPGGDQLQIIRWEVADFPTTTDGNIGLFYADFFSSVTPRPDLTFGIIDNVQVNVALPTPAALPMGLAVMGLFASRRRRRR